jgi:hypothetical protein
MPLEELRLDDLKWEDLVQAARSRIPTASRGQWTLHAPVDPGITLLELFAAQLEERLYWLDQPCDARARAILKLLGVTPRPAAVAATVLACNGEEPDNTKNTGFTYIPRHTEFSLKPPPTALPSPRCEGRQELIFTTRHAIVCLPVETGKDPSGARWIREAVELQVGGKDHTLDLHNGKAVRLWIGEDGTLDVDIILRLREAIPKDTNGDLSLFLDLESPKAILPQWLPGATAPPAPATVTWSYGSEKKGFKLFQAKAVRDFTRALRRSGIVRLPLWDGMAWEPRDDHRYQIRMSIRAAHYTVPPCLRQIVPNAVVAAHRQRVDSTKSDGGKLADSLREWNNVQTPNPAWQLPQTVLPQTVILWLQRVPGQPFERWRRVEDFTFSGPSDRHFQVDRERAQLRFGDGYQGRLPVGKDTKAQLSFDIGGGRAGNLGAGRTWQAAGLDIQAVNVVPAAGGVDSEALAEAAHRAAHEWRQPIRSVTVGDFEYLVQHVPGAAISRARAAVGHHARHPCTTVEGAITVFVVPDVPQPPWEDWLTRPDLWSALKPDPQTLALVRADLERKRLVTQEVFVAEPAYEDIAVTVGIGGQPADADRIRNEVTLALYRLFHPLWGGADGTGWPFGEDVFPSAVMKHTQQALGDELVVTRVAIARVSNPEQTTHCEPLPIGPFRLPNLRSVQLRFVPSLRTEGGLG